MDYSKEYFEKLYKKGVIIRAKTALNNLLRSKTQFLDKEYDKVFPRQRLWHIVNETTKNPGCVVCGKNVRWDDTRKTSEQSYRKYCSKHCQMNHEEFQKRKRITEQQRYGNKREKIVEKTRKTVNERYGVDYVTQVENFKRKRIETVKKRYGVDNVIHLPENIIKRECTMYAKYGVRSYAQKHLSPQILTLLNDPEWLQDQHLTQQHSISHIAKQLNVNNEIISRHLRYYNIPIVYYPSSIIETEVVDYIKNVTQNVRLNVRDVITPSHLDIFVPHLKVAFEINGVYWHNEGQGRGQNYHINKTEMCLNQDIVLCHIFENDWQERTNIVKSLISHMLHDSSISRVYARQCRIDEISSEDARIFFNANHLRGHVPSSVNIALIYNSEIVSVMSFGKPRYSRGHDWELMRFCTKNFTQIMGGGSKLLNHFIKNSRPQSIISYRDRSYGIGTLYKKMGFRFSHFTKPNYKYFKKGSYHLQSRISFQKHKLPKILDRFDPNKTEWENMMANGYDRIWDCGNEVWEWFNNC